MNIKEIAKKAGVSVATVSRVLNHPESVAQKTRERILAVMEESEYTPNWFARGLNFNKTNTIALLIPSMLNPSHMEIAKGVEDIAHQKDYTTLLCNADNDVEKERRYVDSLLKRKVDGIVLVSSLLENQDIELINKQGVPVVAIGENRDISDLSLVRIDCQVAAYNAMRHLMNIGYREIAIIYGGIPEKENLRKLEGYFQALKEEGIEKREEFLVEVSNTTVESGYLAAKKLMALKQKPRAIFASSDLLAFGAIDAMKDFGIRVPEEVAIIGFDNIRMASLVEPKLTTVEKPMHKMGVLGMRLLLDLIEAKEEKKEFPHREILLQSRLKIRKSCGHRERIEEMF